MAIQLSYITKYAISLPSAYFKLLNFSGSKTIITFTVAIYATAESRTAGKRWVDMKTYQIPYSDTNNLTAMYDYLKTLPEYAGAIDV